jgi:pimeloyl-ACP methyl ester carboxylesterase
MTARERMLEGVPVRERFAHPAGVRTAILEAGAGPPIVLLHGGIECGGPVWVPVVEDLAQRYTVVVPDLPGLGESAPVDDLPAVLDEWFRDLVADACAEPPVLLAHSLGGSLAAELASRRGQLLRQLVIYGAPGIGPYRMPLGLRVVAVRFAVRPTRKNGERFERWAFHDHAGFRAREGRWLDAFGDEGRAKARVPYVKRAMQRLIAHGTKRIPDDELRRIPVRVDLMWGRQDRFVPLTLATDASARLGWRLHVIEDSGHVAHIERPASFLASLETILAGAAERAAA